MRNFVLYSVILASVLITPILEAQRAMKMPFFHVVSLAGPALLLIVSFLGAAVLMRMGERTRCGVFAFIAVAQIDIMFGGHAMLYDLTELVDFLPRILKSAIKIIAVLGFSVLVFLVSRRLGKNAAPVLATILGTIMVSGPLLHAMSLIDSGLNQPTWPQSQDRDSTERGEGAPSTKPSPVIHIILDEMMAPEAIDLKMPGAVEAYRGIRRFHERFGFRLYGRAFSRRVMTIESLPDLLNYDYTGTEVDGEIASIHFSEMAKRGYNVVVFQGSGGDHCATDAAVHCIRLSSNYPVSEYASRITMKILDAQLLIAHLGTIVRTMNDSYVRNFLSDLLEHFTPDELSGSYLIAYDVSTFPSWFDKFADDVVMAPNGTYIFAHFLAPHRPYFLQEDCSLPEALTYRSQFALYEHDDDDETKFQARAQMYQRYFEQVSCIYTKLTTLFERMDESGRFEDATIVIHGDHGSRISTTWSIDEMTERDFVDNYPTLFAIRSPGIEPGYDRRLVSIQQLFAEQFAPHPVEPTAVRTVVGRPAHGDPGVTMEIEMPAFGLPEFDLTDSTAPIPHAAH